MRSLSSRMNDMSLAIWMNVPEIVPEMTVTVLAFARSAMAAFPAD